MRLLLLTEERDILGVTDLTGTLWEMTYNGMFNRSVVRVTATKWGDLAWIEIRDDTLTQVTTRMRWPEPCRLAVDDMIHIAIGKFIFTPTVCVSDDSVTGTITNADTKMGAWEL